VTPKAGAGVVPNAAGAGFEAAPNAKEGVVAPFVAGVDAPKPDVWVGAAEPNPPDACVPEV
jgi:hypothetical protein